MHNDLKTLILASGKINGKNKCFINLKGKPVIQYILNALYENSISNITITCDVGGLEESDLDLDLEGKVEFVNEKSNFAENLETAKELVTDKEEPVLVIFGDHPFVRSDSLGYFLDKCDAKEDDVFHGAPIEESLDLFKEFYSKGYVHTKEFAFRAGCMFLLKPLKIDYSILNSVYKMRVQEKIINNLRLFRFITYKVASKLGWDTLGALSLYFRHMSMRFLYNHNAEIYYNKLRNSESSSVKHLEAYASKVLSLEDKIKSKFIPMSFGELALDIDSIEDFENYNKNYEKIIDIMQKEIGRNNIISLNDYKNRKIIAS